MTQQLLHFTLVDYDTSMGEHPVDENGVLLRDREQYWDKMVKNSHILCQKVVNYWQLFESDPYIVCTPDEAKGEISCVLSGDPSLDYTSLQEWRESITFFIKDKAIHEQFPEAALYENVEEGWDVILQILLY